LTAADGGALPDALAASVAAHVRRCSWCRALQADLAQVARQGLDEAEHRRIRERVSGMLADRERRQSTIRRYWWATAGAAGAVAASFVLASIGPSAGELPSPASPPALPIARAASPRSVLQLDKPTLKLPLGAVLSLRGAADARRLDLEQGLTSYKRGDFSEAAVRLQHVVPDDAIPQLGLYLGVSYLHVGDYANAERTLASARSRVPEAFRGDVEWNLALAYIGQGQRARAAEGLDLLCRGASDVAGKACAALVEINR
jgi:tetratricopeptide (TPR) repeat protein